MRTFMTIKKSTVGLTLGAMLALSAVVPAFAADTADISQTVTGGSLSSTVEAAPTFDNVDYSFSDQTSDGTMSIEVDDRRGTGAGWSISLAASDLAYAGTNQDQVAIAASNVSLQAAEAPVSIAGDDTTGLTVGQTGVTLDSARTVLSAAANAGEGTYNQDLTIQLNIPAQTAAGTYSGTLTLTESSGPAD